MSASNANPTGEVGTDQDINQGADFDTQNIINASTDESGAVVDTEKPTNKGMKIFSSAQIRELIKT